MQMIKIIPPSTEKYNFRFMLHFKNNNITHSKDDSIVTYYLQIITNIILISQQYKQGLPKPLQSYYNESFVNLTLPEMDIEKT